MKKANEEKAARINETKKELGEVQLEKKGLEQRLKTYETDKK